jgi:dCTP deaminase
MILSNIEIVKCLKRKCFEIGPLAAYDPGRAPFNTSAVDLRLSDEILVPGAAAPVQLDLTKPGIATHLAKNSERHTITKVRPYSLQPNQFILAKTIEAVKFPIRGGKKCYSARVEGKSSLARCGILVHFTAPTIHAGFEGTITLEVINMGPGGFLLSPGMYFCQLIIEEVRGCPVVAPNQFKGQTTAAGLKK